MTSPPPTGHTPSNENENGNENGNENENENEHDAPSDHGGTDDEGAHSAPPEVVQVLHNETRRTLVRVLLEESELTLVTLASRVASETETPLPDVVIELHDVHLPKLTDCSLVDYDSGKGDISLALSSDTVEAVLSEFEDDGG